MKKIFYNATSFDNPLNSWDVSSVTNMNGMFHTAESFNRPLNSWNVSSVTDYGQMFNNALNFDQYIRNWIVQVNNIGGHVYYPYPVDNMFDGATAMIANQDATVTPDVDYFNQ